MPIIGSTTNASTATLGETTFLSIRTSIGITSTKSFPLLLSHNASSYSHSTVFTTFHYGPLSNTVNLEGKPPLQTQFSAPEACKDRWIVHGDSLAIMPNTTVAGSTPPDATQTVPADESAQIVTLVFHTQPKTNEAEFDASYTSCQPYTMAPTYSPGVCPEGQTLAEITENHSSESGSTVRWWKGSCCLSGMTFGNEWPNACLSHISSGLRARAPITYNSTAYPTYDLTTTVTQDGVPSTTVISNIKTIAIGIAIADPVIVGWEEHDLSDFPTAYASSLAHRIGVSPVQTDPPSDSNHEGHLSTGAKAGIGVGVIIGALIISLAIVLLYLRRKRKGNAEVLPTAGVASGDAGAAEMEEQQAHRKWFLQGRWRSEAAGEEAPREADSKTVHVVPGPPAELDGQERHIETDGRDQFQGDINR